MTMLSWFFFPIYTDTSLQLEACVSSASLKEACSEEEGTHHFLELTAAAIIVFAKLYQLWES